MTDRDVVLVEREGGSPVWWLLLGGVLGAGLALLFAPHGGEKTRQELARGYRRVRRAAADTLDELKDDFAFGDESREEQPGGAGGDREGEGEGGGDEAGDSSEAAGEKPPRRRRRGPAELRGPAPSAREELERRLSEARARRQRVGAGEDDEEPVA